MKKELHILFALSGFYPEHRAGTETYILNLSKELIKLAYKVSIIVPAVGKASDFYNFEGISVYSFSVPKKVSASELNGLKRPSGIEKFSNLIQEIKPDIFHLHSLSRSLHAEHVKVASELRIKTVFTAHLGSTFCINGDLMLFQRHQCDGQVKSHRCVACFIKGKTNYSDLRCHTSAFLIDKLILNSPLSSKFPAYHLVEYKMHQLDLLKKYCMENIAIADWLKQVFYINGFKFSKIIKQGIDSSFVYNRSVINNSHKINLCFIGRMHPDKGIHLIFNAIESFSQTIFDLTIITIPFRDEMEYYNEIKERFYELGYSNWFENLPQTEVSDKLNKASVLILPSTANEAAPLVIQEAFAKKIPVIGSDYIAIKEMVQHNVNGLLFKNGDIQSLKEQLLRLINEPELLQKLSDNIKPVRTFKEVAAEHDEVFRKL